MTLDYQRAHRFAETSYAAWTSHDLAAILDHYADDVEMASPLVSKLAGREDGRIAGKDALSTYFAAGSKRIPRSTSSRSTCSSVSTASCSTTAAPAGTSQPKSSPRQP
jgi:ketosteroid isomerase-like protein